MLLRNILRRALRLIDVASLGAGNLVDGGKLPYGVALHVKAKHLPTNLLQLILDLIGLDYLSA